MDASNEIVSWSESLAIGEKSSLSEKISYQYWINATLWVKFWTKWPEVVHNTEEYVEDNETVEELTEEIDEGKSDMQRLTIVWDILPWKTLF